MLAKQKPKKCGICIRNRQEVDARNLGRKLLTKAESGEETGRREQTLSCKSHRGHLCGNLEDRKLFSHLGISEEFQTKCCCVSWPLLSIYHETPEEQDELKKELCGSEGELRGPKIC